MRVSLAFFHPCHLASHPLSPTYSTLRFGYVRFPSFLSSLRSVPSSRPPSFPPYSLSPSPSPFLPVTFKRGGCAQRRLMGV